jgi:predicted GNAT family acetyltransferase
MPKVYTPTHAYYNKAIVTVVGKPLKKSTSAFNVINVLDDRIVVYSFGKWLLTENKLSEFHINNAKSFFDTEIHPQRQKNKVRECPFVEQTEKPNLLKLTDVLSLGYFKYYAIENSDLDIEHTYLTPWTADCGLVSHNFSTTDPNVGFVVEYNGPAASTYSKNNICDRTKRLGQRLYSFGVNDIVLVDSGFGGAANPKRFLDQNILIGAGCTEFACNIDLEPTLFKRTEGFTFDWPNRLRVKLDGPKKANVGDIVEIQATLMNCDFTDTWIDPPTIEFYPTTTAGYLSHRKVKLVGGVGRFKIDLKDVYSNDIIEVKSNWKYITGDHKIEIQIL